MSEPIQVRLTKLNSNHRELRTDVVNGVIKRWYDVGECFEMVAPPLDTDMEVRYIRTTPIKSIEVVDDDTRILKTVNSTYKLEYI